MTDRTVLELDDVAKSFGSVSVLEDITMEIAAGSLTAIVGPNGSGKTTLLRLLADLLDPTSGSVTYTGTPTFRQFGYLPQQPAFRPGFTVNETMEFYTALVGDDPDSALARVGLDDAGSRRVENLSGGMTRLLGIAQATVGGPPVVVLDEPGSGLDPGMRTRVAAVAAELADAGAAVVLSSHDLELVEARADRVVVLESGSVVADGSPEQLRTGYDEPDLSAVFDAAVTGPESVVEVAGVTE
ncbi:ABC transporter ATP-binding protein [Halovenus marina]|uniref:ABC transporter ATP-binding protein n=1 Tax=Halovenus marina TaxID=3396621 RepID=UPI003F568631